MCASVWCKDCEVLTLLHVLLDEMRAATLAISVSVDARVIKGNELLQASSCDL